MNRENGRERDERMTNSDGYFRRILIEAAQDICQLICAGGVRCQPNATSSQREEPWLRPHQFGLPVATIT